MKTTTIVIFCVAMLSLPSHVIANTTDVNAERYNGLLTIVNANGEDISPSEDKTIYISYSADQTTCTVTIPNIATYDDESLGTLTIPGVSIKIGNKAKSLGESERSLVLSNSNQSEEYSAKITSLIGTVYDSGKCDLVLNVELQDDNNPELPSAPLTINFTGERSSDFLTKLSPIVIEESVSVEYYTLQGARISVPEHGVYIVRQGNKVQKRAF